VGSLYVAQEYELSGVGSPAPVSEAHHGFLVDDERLDKPVVLALIVAAIGLFGILAFRSPGVRTSSVCAWP
jgi:hypothetical protein